LLFAIFLISCSIFLHQVDATRAVAKSQLSTYTQNQIGKYTKCEQTPLTQVIKFKTCERDTSNKVCAFLHEHYCKTPPCYGTIDGGCYACRQHAGGKYAYHGYLEGDCQTIGMLPAPAIPSGATYCGNRFDVESAAKNLATCPKTGKGVCAHLHQGENFCTTPPCKGSWDNACLACNKLNKEGTSRINYYVKSNGSCTKQRANLRKECKKDDPPAPRNIIEDGDIISIKSVLTKGFLERVRSFIGNKGGTQSRVLVNNKLETENSYWEIRHADRSFTNKHFKTGDEITFIHVLSQESIFTKSTSASEDFLFTGAEVFKFKFIFAKRNGNLMVGDNFNLMIDNKSLVVVYTNPITSGGHHLVYHNTRYSIDNENVLYNIGAIHTDYKK
jgi:hypothetical protein